MSLRIGFEIDVLADFARAAVQTSDRIGGTSTDLHTAHELRRRRDAIWKAIEGMPDFWRILPPIEEGGVRRIHQAMLRHGWEVFFITQPPPAGAETVQRQMEQWLAAQGFDPPNVIVVSGSRGATAAARRLDFHVGDSPQHCLEIRRDSTARPILIAPDEDAATVDRARKLGIGVAPSLSACLTLLEKATTREEG